MGFQISRRVMSISRIALIILNAVYVAIGLVMIGLGIYLLLYKADYLSVLFEMPHIKASCIIIIFCGAFIMLWAFIGIFAAFVVNKCMLATYFTGLVLIALLAAAAGIAAIVYKNTWYIDELRLKMRDVLQTKYGVNLNNSQNAYVTKIWNQVQDMWYCCGVEDNSWGIFRQSQWYNNQPGYPGTKEFLAKMVPESCCMRDQYGNYINLRKCQNWQLGPPNIPSGQDTNEALHYPGCFTIGRNLLTLIGGGVIGLGIGGAIVLAAGIILGFMLFWYAKEGEPINAKPYSTQRAHIYQPSADEYGQELHGLAQS